MRSDYLLDTSVLSELAPGRPSLPSELDVWFMLNAHRFNASIISVAEVSTGIAKLRRGDAASQDRADAYERWLGGVIEVFVGRLHGFDMRVARMTGEVMDRGRKEGANPGFADVAIAATAAVHDLTILTRNLKHFIPLGVPCLDPFEPAGG